LEEVSGLHSVREDERKLDKMISGSLQRGDPRSVSHPFHFYPSNPLAHPSLEVPSNQNCSVVL